MITPMSLNKLLKPFVAAEVAASIGLDVDVAGLSSDSRTIKQDDLFIACPGYTHDARDYMAQVLEKGAWVVAEAHGLEAFNTTSSKVIAIEDLSQKISAIAARFHQKPTSKQQVIGVTGTNGKTSCCYLVSQVLGFLQHKTLMLSTLGNGDHADLEKSANTTPDALSVQRLASEFLAEQYHYLAMEVSSHGLSLGRVTAVDYDVAVFTNLSHDHLDFHGDMDSYFEAKRSLFLSKNLKHAVINADDSYGQKLLADPSISAKKIAFSLKGKDYLFEQGFLPENSIYCENAQFSLKGIQAELFTPWGQAKLRSPLLGAFNLANLLAVAGCLGALFGEIEKWIIGLNQSKAVPGRMQCFSAEQKATVVVDYAHTPDALEKALVAARAHTQGNLWCIFGCGGDRDTRKRASMAQAAEQYADKQIITDDNPRTESAQEIAQMIQAGFKAVQAPYIADRYSALEFALEQAKASDLILLAGKGHEDYQEIGGQKKHYSDLESAETLMQVSA